MHLRKLLTATVTLRSLSARMLPMGTVHTYRRKETGKLAVTVAVMTRLRHFGTIEILLSSHILERGLGI